MRNKITKNPDFKYIELTNLFSESENFEVLITFLDARGGINATDENGRTALINCITNIANPIQKFSFANGFAKKLIDKGIDINLPDLTGRVALHFCLSSKNDEIFNYLLNKPQINLDVKPKLLDFAFSQNPTHHEPIIKLLQLGLNPFEKETNKASFYETLKLFDQGEATIGGNKIDVSPILEYIKLNKAIK